MNPRHPAQDRSILPLLLALLLAGPAISPGANQFWTNSAGGSYSNSANWNAAAPAIADAASFTNANVAYTVTVGSLVTNAAATFSGNGATVVLNAAGNTLWLTNTLTVNAGTAGNDSTLVLAGGTLNVTNISSGASMTLIGGSARGTFIVSNGAFNSSSVVVGQNAGVQGTLNIYGGTNTLTASGYHVILGSLANSTGNLLMAGSSYQGAVVYATNADLRIGSAGMGVFTVSNGTWFGNVASLGVSTGAQGTMNLFGGSNIFKGNLLVGGNGGSGTGTVLMAGNAPILSVAGATWAGSANSFGTMTISNGTFLSSALLNLAGGAGSQGTLILAGGTNLMTGAGTSGNIQVGTFGRGSLQITDPASLLLATSGTTYVGFNSASGGDLTVLAGTYLGNTFAIGNSANATGTVLVAGSNARVFVTNGTATTTIGSSGVGTLTVSNGLYVSSVVQMGLASGAQGTMNLFGGTNVVTSSFIVGGGTGGTGTVLVADNNALLVITNAATGFRLGNNSNSAGLFTLSNGILRLDNNAGLNIIANAAGANGTLNLAGGLLDGVGANPIIVGQTAHGSTGAVNISSGTVNLSGITMFGGNAVTNALATLRLSGGTLNLGNVAAGGITIGGITNDTATVQVSGGTFNLGAGGIALATSAAPSRTNLFLSGGTLGTLASWGSVLNFALTNDVGTGTVAFAPSSTNTITLSGNLSGNGTLVKGGTGILALGGSNSFTGGLYLSNGTLSASLLTNFGPGPLFVRGGFVRATAATFSNLNALTVNWDSFDGGVDVAYTTVPFTISNALSGAGSLTKRGIGTLALLAADGRTGATVVDGGILLLTNNGTLLATSGITIQAAPGTNGTLVLDNRALATATANRIGDSVGVTLNGASLTLIGSNATATSQFVEDAGALTIGPGASAITVTNGATLRFASYTRQTGGTLVLSTNTSTGALGPVKFLTAPGASNGVIPSIVLGGTDWGTHDGDGSAIRAYSNYVTTLTGVATDNVKYNASSTLPANQTNNTLIMVGGAHPVLNLGGNTLTLLGGGLLLQSDSTTALTNGTVAFPGEGIIDTEASSLAAIAVRSVGLTKAGGGNGGFLYLTGNSDLGGGNLNINAGVVNATSNSTLANVNAIVANVGAGRSGTPAFNVNGGTVTANSFAATNTPYANTLPLAINSGALTLSNGINLTALGQILPIASGGNATLNLLGGVSFLNLAGGTLQVGSANSSGTLNVLGGTNTFAAALSVNGSGATSLASFLGGSNQLNGSLTIGVAGALTSQVIVAGPQTVLSFANANAINIAGYGAASLVISNNARVILAPNGSGFLNFGTANGQKDAVILISDGGSLTSGYQFQFGNNNPIATTNMSLVVSNGGSASFIGGGINNLSTSNRIIVTGAGSRFISGGGSGFGIGLGNGTNNYNEALILDGGSLMYSTVAGTSPGASSIGGSYAAMSNRLVVAGGGSAYYAGGVNVGNAANTLGNQITVSNGGNLTIVGALNLGAFAGAYSNLMVVDGSASLATVGGGAVGNVGGTVGNLLVVTNGGRMISTATFYIGNAATNNYARVTGAGSVWSNAALQVGAAAGSVGNTLSILNGGLVVDTSGNIGNLLGATSNTVEVSGSGSTWNNMGLLQVGYKGAANILTISNGGAVMSLGASAVGGGNNGGGVGASNNFALVTDPGSVWSNSGGIFNVGYNSGGNTLVISNGGTVISLATGANSAQIGGNGVGDTTGNDNAVIVTGSGSTWTNSGLLAVGFAGSRNSLIISSSGTVVSVGGTIGFNATSSNNTTLVTGPASKWNAGVGDLTVGSSIGNSLVISNGGTVSDNRAFIGYPGASASNNTALVTGAGSLWTNAGLVYVGYNGGFSTLTISRSGTVVSAGGTLGYNNAASGNNTLIITDTGSTWNAGIGSVTLGNTSAGPNNRVIVSNGASVFSGTLALGGTATSYTNSVVLSGSSWVSSNLTSLGSANTLSVLDGSRFQSVSALLGNVGNGAATTSNLVVTVAGQGSSWTNLGTLTVGNYSSYAAQVLVTNGAILYSSGALIVGGGNTNYNDLLLVSGPGSQAALPLGSAILLGGGSIGSGNQLIVSNGASLAAGGLLVGSGVGDSNNLFLASGAGTFVQFAQGGGLTVGSNGVLILGSPTPKGHGQAVINNGAVMEANILAGGFTGSGIISNTAGVFQFTTNTPSITPGTASAITLNNGTIAFRGITNADVMGSLGSNQVGNLLFAGNNIFRLNNASNFSAGAQDYTFNSGVSPSNYVGLEMINGGTAWKSAWLAISKNGSMLVSNTSASILGVLTNSGTIRVVNASATFASNVVLSGGSFTSQGGTNTFGAGGLFLNGGLLALDSASQVFGTVSNWGGTISLLNTANADIKGNWKNNLTTGLTNMVWLGTNTFRLDNSSTTNTGQDYVFDSGLGVTNYARLEMVNGTTLWQGGSLTIGANGTMLASNTTATIQGYATNSGNIRVVNALAIWASNVVLNGGVFVAQNATNQFNGGLSIASGQTLSFTNGNSRMTGVVSNNTGSTIQAINSIVTWQDAVVIGGRYFSDPSTNIFTTNLTVTASGVLQGSNGDLFVFYKDFLNQSTVNTNFSLWQAAVLFTNGAGTSSHTYDVTGSGSANWGTGFTNFDRVSTNFAIGTLSIAAGNRLMITGQVGGGITNAVYVGWLDIQGWSTNGGFSSVTNTLFSALNLPDINLYYSREDPRNQWLNDWIPGTGYNLWNGGLLLPIPEPSTWLAMGGGLALLAFLCRRKAG